MIPPHIKDTYILSNYIYLYFYPLPRQWKVLPVIKFPFTTLLIFVVIYLVLYLIKTKQGVPVVFFSVSILSTYFHFNYSQFFSACLTFLFFFFFWPFFWGKFSSSRRNVYIIFSSARLLATKLHGFVSPKMYLLHLHSWRICFLEMQFQIQSYCLSAL